MRCSRASSRCRRARSSCASARLRTPPQSRSWKRRGCSNPTVTAANAGAVIGCVMIMLLLLHFYLLRLQPGIWRHRQALVLLALVLVAPTLLMRVVVPGARGLAVYAAPGRGQYAGGRAARRQPGHRDHAGARRVRRAADPGQLRFAVFLSCGRHGRRIRHLARRAGQHLRRVRRLYGGRRRSRPRC